MTDFGRLDVANGVALQGNGKIVAVGDSGAGGNPRLRARPLQPERDARPELLRRRQADDRLRGLRPSEWGGAPSERQDRGGRRRRAVDFALARYNPNGSLDPSFSGDGRQTTDFGGFDGRAGWRSRETARSSRSAAGAPATGSAPCTSRSPATTRTGRSTRASPATAGRRPTSGASTGRAGWRSRTTAKSSQSAPAAPSPPTSRSPATTPTARSTRASPATAGRGPTSGAPRGRAGWRSRATARSSRSAAGRRQPKRLRARPLQPQRDARPELLRRRQADDRLRGLRRGDGVALQGDGKIVAVGGAGRDGAQTSRSPATTRTARSTRASPATAGRRPTSGASTQRPGWRSRATARSS